MMIAPPTVSRRSPTFPMLTVGQGRIGVVEFDPKARFRPWVVPYVEASGRRRRRGHSTEKEALAFRGRLMEQAAAASSASGSHGLTEVHALVRARLSGARLKRFDGIWRAYIFPLMGGCAVHEVVLEGRTRLLVELVRAGVGRSRQYQVLGAFDDLLTEAKSRRWIGHDRAWASPKLVEPTTRARAGWLAKPRVMPSVETLQLILRESVGVLRIVIHLAIYAGLRIGEILALEWQEVDFDEGFINVVASILDGDRNSWIKPRRKQPKSSHGYRSIPMDEDLAAVLKEWRGEQWSASDRVLFRPGQEYRSRLCLHADLQTLLARLGIAKRSAGGMDDCRVEGGFGMHAFRHACVAIWIFAGVSPQEIRRLVGHAHVDTTLRSYGYLIELRNAGADDWAQDMADPDVASAQIVEVRGHSYRPGGTVRPAAAARRGIRYAKLAQTSLVPWYGRGLERHRVNGRYAKRDAGSP